MFIVQRSLSFLWIIFLIIALILSSLNLNWMFNSPGSSGGPSETTTTVGESGFRIRLDGVLITAGEDVAPAGTRVQARFASYEIPEIASGFAEQHGEGVEITIGDGEQPATPITIRYSADFVQEWFSSTNDDDLMPVVLASKDGGGGVEFADAHLQPDGSVTVVTDHLSWFQTARASVSGFANWMVEQVEIGMNTRSEQPGCVNASSSEQEWEFSEIPEDILWPCVSSGSTGVEATLTLNSTGVWLISSDDATPGYPVSTSLLDGIISAFYLQTLDQGTTSPLLPPGAKVTFTATDPGDELLFHAELSTPLTTVNSVLSVLLSVTPSKKLDQLSQAQCMIDIVSESVSGVNLDGSFVRMIVDCFSAVVGGITGAFIGLMTSGPTALATQLDGIHRQITGRSEFSFTLTRTEEEVSQSSSPSTWPTHRSDSVTGLYIWLGANMYAFPDWVACDDARDYCLIGNDGDWHIVLEVDGFTVLGEIHDTYEDPRGGLIILGVPEGAADEILGD